jgi:hypothetical protein
MKVKFPLRVFFILSACSTWKVFKRISTYIYILRLIFSAQEVIQLDENGEPMMIAAKPRRKKERTEEEKAARKERKERKERKRLERGMSKDRGASAVRAAAAEEEYDREGQQQHQLPLKNKQHPVGGDLLQQVSAKLLQQLGEEEQQQLELAPAPPPSQLELAPLPPSSLFPTGEKQLTRPRQTQQASMKRVNPLQTHLFASLSAFS